MSPHQQRALQSCGVTATWEVRGHRRDDPSTPKLGLTGDSVPQELGGGLRGLGRGLRGRTGPLP